ncbi:ER degradation-enhancing alpha-mannosidase 1 [Brachionus plicatilis]|uniref:alpha-1,2-Mannosidase n=1 Tax=Brachionus plicatilis TaxID=10195 RepID=A0A3M7Q1F6_BRAPC|nr:ER degradation-enhancing alpha-mannosidase 1 [Brachionus plicatilis]
MKLNFQSFFSFLIYLEPILCFSLDYTLYSQLNTELNDDINPNNSPNSILNYFKLTNETLKDYDSLLYFPEKERIRLKNLAHEMFTFGYDHYMKHAYPLDELDPIHCRGRGPDHLRPENINVNDALGDYLLTLVDSLTTLIVMGNSSEFKLASKLVMENLNFDKNSTVQVFEATIRLIGSLLSSHLVTIDPNQPFGDMKIDNYENEFLNLAHDLAVRLLTAFNNDYNILPYPRVNLKIGVPLNSFNHTCTSGAGSLLLEFGTLSYLLNDTIYEKVARLVSETIFLKKNPTTGLVGNELNIKTGNWQGLMSGLGAGIDSYLEYLLKGFVLFGNPKDLYMFNELKKSIKKYLRHGRGECLRGKGHHPIYINVNMNTGSTANNWIDSLQAFYSGVQVLDNDLDEAVCFHALYFAIWKKFAVLPERFNWNLKLPDIYFYPLRPEFAEATYFLYRATKSPFYLHAAKLIIENLNNITRVKCGFATVHDVLDKSLEDRMESFFLSETLKYLYLTFDKENYLNNEGEINYVFTTEGHMLPIKTLYQIKSHLEPENQQENFNYPRESNKNIYKHKLRYNLPMKISYFDQLFEMIGLSDNLTDLLVKSQEEGFESAINSLIQQWGEITPEQFQEFFDNFQQFGLHHIWHSLDEHCSSNAECGPDACCLKPNLTGKRAITDGSHIHFGSYCAKLRRNGETCSHFDWNMHYYNFHCPCDNGLTCVPGGTVQLHPLIIIQTEATCKAV